MSAGVRRALVLLSIAFALGFSPYALPSRQPPGKTTPAAVDKEQVKRGEAIFNRHCPICHLGRPSKTNPLIGKNLRGILKGVKPERESGVRESIRTGSDKMPGYQHTLTSTQLDDLMAYLKTYN